MCKNIVVISLFTIVITDFLKNWACPFLPFITFFLILQNVSNYYSDILHDNTIVYRKINSGRNLPIRLLYNTARCQSLYIQDTLFKHWCRFRTNPQLNCGLPRGVLIRNCYKQYVNSNNIYLRKRCKELTYIRPQYTAAVKSLTAQAQGTCPYHCWHRNTRHLTGGHTPDCTHCGVPQGRRPYIACVLRQMRPL